MFAINDAHCKNIYENRYSYGTVSVNNYTLVYKNICNNKFSRWQRCWLLARSFLPCQARFLARFAFRHFALVLPHFSRKKKSKKCDALLLPTHRWWWCVRCDWGGLPPWCVGVPCQWTGGVVREVEGVLSVFFIEQLPIASVLHTGGYQDF